DTRGTAGLGAGLEGLGVYGADTSVYTTSGIIFPTSSYVSKSNTYMATTAVQKSIALQLDAKINSFWKQSPIQLSKEGLSSNSALYSQNGFDTHPGLTPSVSTIPGNLSYGSGGGDGSI